MKRFVLGMDRVQSTLLPGCLDDFIDESDPVRAIDAFVDALNLAELGFRWRVASSDWTAVVSSVSAAEALHLWLS